jgi:hypothetical protein
MPGPLIAGIAGSVGSALIQGKAADKAASAQSAAADAQIAESRRQFDLIQGLMSPYVNAGTAGLQAQLDLMGLGGKTGGTVEAFTDGGNMSASGIINGGTQRFRVGDKKFNTRDEAQAYAATLPGGVSAQDAQRNAIAGIEGGAQFGQLVKQGEYGLLANGAATGGLRGGDTQGAIAQFRPQMLQALIDKQLAQYGGLAASGQNAAANLGTAAQNTGAQVNAALGDRGAALAGGALARGQAWANAGSGILSTLGQVGGQTQPGGGPWARWQF